MFLNQYRGGDTLKQSMYIRDTRTGWAEFPVLRQEPQDTFNCTNCFMCAFIKDINIIHSTLDRN